jgi:hypothetical protein
MGDLEKMRKVCKIIVKIEVMLSEKKVLEISLILKGLRR